MSTATYPSMFTFSVCCVVRDRALASHTGVRRFDSRGGDCLLLLADYKLRSIYKSRKAQWSGIHFKLGAPSKFVLVYTELKKKKQ